MVDARHYTLFAVTSILVVGTAYSVVKDTYLDTSNPLISHLPHKLSATHYFASKRNLLNVYFIKRAWGWTTALFLFSYGTSPVQTRTKDRLFKYLTATAIWLLFTSWFFGPALLERLVVYSGGECTLSLPSGDVISVPNDLCYTRTSVTQQSHPHLFPATFTDVTVQGWRSVPRLRRGHDVSGHIFLLTLSILFLVDQLRPSFKYRQWSSIHTWAIAGNLVLAAIWLFSIYTTSVYFHSPFEKITGYLLGLASFLLTQALFGGDVQTHPRTIRA